MIGSESCSSFFAIWRIRQSLLVAGSQLRLGFAVQTPLGQSQSHPDRSLLQKGRLSAGGFADLPPSWRRNNFLSIATTTAFAQFKLWLLAIHRPRPILIARARAQLCHVNCAATAISRQPERKWLLKRPPILPTMYWRIE